MLEAGGERILNFEKFSEVKIAIRRALTGKNALKTAPLLVLTNYFVIPAAISAK